MRCYKGLKWRKNMDIKLFLAKRVLELELGRYFGPQYIQFFLILGVFIKTYFKNISITMYVIIFTTSLLGIWLLGFFMLHTGFYEKYQFEIPAFKKLKKELERK